MPGALRKLNVVIWTPVFDEPRPDNLPPELIAYLMKDGKPSVWLADLGSPEARAVITALACGFQTLPAMTQVAHFDLATLQQRGLDVRLNPVPNGPVPAVSGLHYEIHLKSEADAASLVRAVQASHIEKYTRDELANMVLSAFDRGEVELANCRDASTTLIRNRPP